MLPQISSLKIKLKKTESETWFFVNERAMITTTLMPSLSYHWENPWPCTFLLAKEKT